MINTDKLKIDLKDKTVYLSGRMDLSRLKQFNDEVLNFLHSEEEIYEINFSKIESNDSSVFALLMQILRYKKDIQIKELPQSLLSLIEVARLEDLLG